ncbi:MAG: hypothetical protein Q4B42_03830 [Oscillospiraceae bacterium]|nr:hypothetical protein [Oscillospiraceae bacterium]
MRALLSALLILSLSLKSGLAYIVPPSEREKTPPLPPEAAKEALSQADFEGGFAALSLDSKAADELIVYPEGFDYSPEIGRWLQFRVFWGERELSYKEFTLELVSGFDCAAAYYTGEVLTLGEGEFRVRAYLDETPEMDGFSAAVKIAPAAEAGGLYALARSEIRSETPADAAFENEISAFPESYKPYLRGWHKLYPSWSFRAIDTGLDFWSSVEIQSSGARNVTLLANFSDLLKSRDAGDYDRETGQYILKDTGWVETSELAVSYYLDPRSELGTRGVFQHESLSYDESFHSLEGIESVLRGSFMEGADTDYLDSEGNLIETGVSYAEAIMNAALETGVNPYYLAAKIRGEIGAVKSRSVTGDVEDYEGYYNYYNIGATDGEGNIERALEYAMGSGSYGRPWDSPEKAIVGGARFLAADYVAAGQDTGYLQKWNVAPYSSSTRHLHQYMTNVSGALAQSYSSYSAYAAIDMLSLPIEFAVPVFENMPANTAEALASSEDGQQTGLTAARAYLRSEPRQSADLVKELPALSCLEIISAVPTNADYYYARLFSPYWYYAAYTEDGERWEGYVSAELAGTAAELILEEGESAAANIVALPLDCGDDVKYISRNYSVADVSSDGEIFALSAGRTQIVAYTANGCFYIKNIFVAPAAEAEA